MVNVAPDPSWVSPTRRVLQRIMVPGNALKCFNTSCASKCWPK